MVKLPSPVDIVPVTMLLSVGLINARFAYSIGWFEVKSTIIPLIDAFFIGLAIQDRVWLKNNDTMIIVVVLFIKSINNKYYSQNSGGVSRPPSSRQSKQEGRGPSALPNSFSVK